MHVLRRILINSYETYCYTVCATLGCYCHTVVAYNHYNNSRSGRLRSAVLGVFLWTVAPQFKVKPRL